MKKKGLIVALTLATAAAGFSLTACGNGDAVNLEDLVKLVDLTNNGDKVNSNFTVPSFVTTTTGKNYKLTWHSNNEELLSFTYVEDDTDTAEDESLEDATAVVKQGDKLTEVLFYATVTDGMKTAKTSDFSVRIEKAVSAEEKFKVIYDGAAEKIKTDIAGYVLAKAGKSVYNDKGQCCLYIASDIYEKGAYYAYNCYMDEADYDALQVGDYVTVTSAQFQVYSGIVEACYGNVKKDASKTALTAAEVAAKTQDITNTVAEAQDLATALFYTQGNRVQLKSAKVKSITTKPYSNTKGKYSSTLQEVLVLDVNGNDVKLQLEEGITSFADEATATLFTSLTGLTVGSLVDVEGILVGTDTIAVEGATSVVASTSVAAFAKVAATQLETEFENVVETKEITLPATGTQYNDVAVTWALKDTYTTAQITDGKLVVTPGAEEEKITLVATYTIGDYTKTVEYKFSSQTLTDQQMVEKEAELFDFEDTYAVTHAAIDLPATGTKFAGVAITYTVKQGQAAVSTAGGKLRFKVVAEDTDVTLSATFTLNEATYTKDVEFKVTGDEYKATTQAVTGVSDGATVKVTGIVTSKGSNLCWITDGTTDFEVYKLADESTYKWDDIEVGDVIYVTGTYKLYNTTHETNADGNIVDKRTATDAEKVAWTKSELALPDLQENVTNQALAATGTVYNDATISWAIKTGTTPAGVTVTDNKLTVVQQDTDVEVTLVATITVGTTTDTQEVKFTVKQASSTKTKSAAFAGAANVVTEAGTNYAADLGLDATIFTVNGAQNGANTATTFNSSGKDIRLYASRSNGNGGALTISVDATQYTIDSIKIVFKQNGDVTSVFAGTSDTAVTASNDVYTINAASVTIKNTQDSGTSNKNVFITSIEITYTKK